jgi:hypothetical protein
MWNIIAAFVSPPDIHTHTHIQEGGREERREGGKEGGREREREREREQGGEKEKEREIGRGSEREKGQTIDDTQRK